MWVCVYERDRTIHSPFLSCSLPPSSPLPHDSSLVCVCVGHSTALGREDFSSVCVRLCVCVSALAVTQLCPDHKNTSSFSDSRPLRLQAYLCCVLKKLWTQTQGGDEVIREWRLCSRSSGSFRKSFRSGLAVTRCEPNVLKDVCDICHFIM